MRQWFSHHAPVVDVVVVGSGERVFSGCLLHTRTRWHLLLRRRSLLEAARAHCYTARRTVGVYKKASAWGSNALLNGSLSHCRHVIGYTFQPPSTVGTVEDILG